MLKFERHSKKQMTTNIYDIAIIGAGVGGVFSALRLAKLHKAKTILIEFGAGPAKRRRQLEGWLGSFPAGDGKLYTSNIDQILNIADGRKVNPAFRWVKEILEESTPLKLIKDSFPSASMQKKLGALGFDIISNDYFQWKPESIHKLSKIITDQIEESGLIEYSFNNEVFKILKKKNFFQISTENGDIHAKKVILAVGRSGWRWATKLYKDLGICSNDDYAKFGIRVEISGQHLKEFNKSHCTLVRSDLELGPFSWNGTIIPEDHADFATSAFRSNENRWRSEKVSFSVIGKRLYKNQGVHQTDRLGKLAHLLYEDRVAKERIKTFSKGKTQLNLLPEYNWLVPVLTEIEQFIPSLLGKGYFHTPDVLALPAEIRLNNSLESEIDGLFVIGESAGIKGIMGAAVSGSIAADSACK